MYELQQEVSIPEPYVWTSKVKIPAPTKLQYDQLAEAKTDTEANKIVLGVHFQEIEDYYNGRPVVEHRAFIADINKHFFGPGAGEVEGKSPGSSG